MLSRLYNKYLPLVTNKSKSTGYLLRSIKKKNKLHETFTRNRSHRNEYKLKSYRNKMNNLL